MMLNLFLSERLETEFEEIYRVPYGQQIIKHYLNRSECDEVLRNEYPKKELIEFLYERSQDYESVGKTVLSLRLEELASEIELTKESIERIQHRYERDHKERNIMLAKRTISFFE